MSSHGRRISFSAGCLRGVLLPGLSLLVACGRGSDKKPTTLRLAKLYKPASVSTKPGWTPAFLRTEWRFDRPSSQKRPAAPEYELYDVRKDPLNLRDLSAANVEKVRELSQALRKWRSEALAARKKSTAEEAQAPSAEELERLRSLGYVQ
jgi:hypothetical protein